MTRNHACNKINSIIKEYKSKENIIRNKYEGNILALFISITCGYFENMKSLEIIMYLFLTFTISDVIYEFLFALYHKKKNEYKYNKFIYYNILSSFKFYIKQFFILIALAIFVHIFSNNFNTYLLITLIIINICGSFCFTFINNVIKK